MSLKLLIDEDSLAKLLVKLLRAAGHDVVTVNEAGLSGESDEVVFYYAKARYIARLTDRSQKSILFLKARINKFIAIAVVFA